MVSGPGPDRRESGARFRAAWRHAAAFSIAPYMALLSSCTIFPNEPNTLEIFDLHASAAAAAYVGEAVTWQLAVSEFSAREPVSGVRIAVRGGDLGYSVLRGARWSLPAPQLVQAVLIEAFEESGRVPGVGPVGTVRGQCELTGELREFSWVPASSQVMVTAAIRLQCGARRVVQAMRTFGASHAIEGRGAAAVASAFDAALETLTPEVVQWALANGPT